MKTFMIINTMKKLLLLSIIALMFSCSNDTRPNLSREDLLVDEFYLYSRHWPDPNPFNGELDTVLILAISGSYINWVSLDYIDSGDVSKYSKSGDLSYITYRFKNITTEPTYDEGELYE